MLGPKHKVGDTIYFEDWHGEIGARRITGIRPDCYYNDEGKLVEFYYYMVGDCEVIEDYNCLDDNDPRIQECSAVLDEIDSVVINVYNTRGEVVKTYKLSGPDIKFFGNEISVTYKDIEEK